VLLLILIALSVEVGTLTEDILTARIGANGVETLGGGHIPYTDETVIATRDNERGIPPSAAASIAVTAASSFYDVRVTRDAVDGVDGGGGRCNVGMVQPIHSQHAAAVFVQRTEVDGGGGTRGDVEDTESTIVTTADHLAAGGGEGCAPDGATVRVGSEFGEERLEIPLDDAAGETDGEETFGQLFVLVEDEGVCGEVSQCP